MVVEQQADIGGNWASVRTPWGLVDRGVLIPHEVGVSAFDELFYEVLPHACWNLLEGARRDISGNIFRGHIDQGSLYPDLRRLERHEYARCRAEIISRASGQRPGIADARSLHEFLSCRFGPSTTELVHRLISEKFWRLPLQQMSAWAGKVVHVARVVLDSAEASIELKKDPLLDAVIGYPDQLRIPASMQSSRRAFYPKKFGLSTVIGAFREALASQGVELLTSTAIVGIHTADKRIGGIDLATPAGPRHEAASAVLWTSPLAGLGKILQLKFPEPPDAPIPHRVVHLFLDRAPNTGELYWLWSYDGSNSITRFTNYAAYCPDAASGGTFPVCVETHIDPARADDGAVVAQVEKEIRECGLIEAATRIVGSAVLPAVRVFPISSIANCDALAKQRRAVEQLGLQNLLLSNQDISAGRFYLADILAASVPLLEEL